LLLSAVLRPRPAGAVQCPARRAALSLLNAGACINGYVLPAERLAANPPAAVAAVVVM